ncbi:MAG TPA: PIG-L family deacetylase [Dermatophilaceae bacterium]
MAHTLLAFHAHPDDEALLTAGTMARAAAGGHRVILVVATDGNEGLAADVFSADGRLGELRLNELRESARALGVARVEHLGYADSGSGPQPLPGRTRFVRADVDEAAGRLADILREESVDVLLTYDANGGYGHRDHVKVHEVGARAAELANTPRVLQATVPRDALCRAVALAGKVYRFPATFDPTTFERSYSSRADITHRVNVRRYASAKRAAMRAHASQASAEGGADRTLAAFLRIPRPLFDVIFGREWFVDPAHPPGAPISRDVFAGLA